MDKYRKSNNEPAKRHEKSRSRSPINRYEESRKHNKRDGRRSSPSSSSSSEDERKYESKKSIPPPAPKISMSLNKPSIQPSKGIQIKLGTQAKPPPAVVQKTSKITSVFNIDESDEDEEMPPEAKMRMKNIGKDTPTSSGPNSYGKTKQGFVDSKKMFERKLKQMADELSKD